MGTQAAAFCINPEELERVYEGYIILSGVTRFVVLGHLGYCFTCEFIYWQTCEAGAATPP